MRVGRNFGDMVVFFSLAFRFCLIFLVGSSLWKNFFKVKHRTWIVETESTCSILSPRRPLHNLFSAVFAVQDFLWEIVHPNTPAPSKKNWSVFYKFNPVMDLVVEISNELRFALESYKRLDKETKENILRASSGTRSISNYRRSASEQRATFVC